MIIRIYRGTVFAGKQRLWQERVESLSIPWLRKQAGLIAFYPGKPPAESTGRTFCMVMVWDGLESVKAAIGPDWNNAIYHGDEAELIESAQVEHFELFP
ncbi:hypothetical protein EN858_00310 [Mesorhizobium sp. M4B.F.Ca.ET.215.01.1.1]|uniref:hypothetical protein n=1 Tax=unclassified Mesorhizobium TaxID=325217 RepID=UPI000FCC2C68|nr:MULTISPECIES: hypothetical protein [unclassified Mesorhizobium]RUW27696.1 hypothetical protein EOA34_03810 [Mesorhizobium sp. M4B.F.Ca.ET.013.02.1.1]RVD45181.1 hypothetical protein EN741_06315 [Mesorhizobium sp. M4B.F.Ca.ET.019.03.1.1]RWF62440.1 MAG: hypothetical protein EOS47_23460 [Mesorhizobium sp.]TGQ18307.1 hypothetical protein EN858_00310 [Mesorhizobium sp. M4B.F.Ca.ET.215.01.1.1]TGQ27258.1 hypothetical protein EN863_049065 [Mesorhizobium sp. M00.F.Ca.ET.220.01.1.1]